MADLPIDYLDDILAPSMNGKRKFKITHSDGTYEEVTIEDVSEYEQVGSTFGAVDINRINEEVNGLFLSVSNGKALIASAITDKKVPTDATATFAQMAENILSLVLGSGTAQKNHVLAPYTFTNNDGVEYTGTIPTNKSGTYALTVGKDTTGITVYIPYGFYDNYLNGKAYVYIDPSVMGDAAVANVLAGKTFTSANGVKVTGTMTNQGAKTSSLNCGGSYTIPAGYHNGSGKITANSLASQTSATAAAAQLTTGYTAWVNGSKITGTRPAPVTRQTGSKTLNVPKSSTASTVITFQTIFDKVPTVSATVTSARGAENNDNAISGTTAIVSNVTRSSFTLTGKTTWSNQTIVTAITWVAQA